MTCKRGLLFGVIYLKAYTLSNQLQYCIIVRTMGYEFEKQVLSDFFHYSIDGSEVGSLVTERAESYRR